MHDLVNDPGEMENLAHAEHPAHHPAPVERMLGKLYALVREEIGEERVPFDLNIFGTREIKYRKEKDVDSPSRAGERRIAEMS